MTIRTNPPGATAYVDDYEVGVTPISTNFTYYGTRKIRLVKDGYETLTVMQPVAPTWYQITPLDFVTENLVPGELRDQRTFCYQLRPQMIVPREQLLSRAEQLRHGQPAAPPAAQPPAMPAAPPALPSAGSAPAPWGRGPVPGAAGVGGQTVHPLPPGAAPGGTTW